jgi:hypothetical protein
MSKSSEVLAAIPAPAKLALDGASAVLVVSSIIELLPSLAALLSVCWLIWQMYDRVRYGPSKGRSKGGK